ncbi:extracellular solute-binding protein [Thermocaproicibacter melissae]|uniref:extracellular solute-binding protein n=1 Tax=Thermocaproicibacter melissae TaxID=2966552 RepID=UPI0024B20E34|nr:extracellular solute-binding protein [Thermocaproicibacter melissae]WBY63730.1 extracellular solute-binding protein [Thermocaproicibacter melissae]
MKEKAWKRVSVGFLAAALTVSLTACNGGSSSTSSTTTETSQAESSATTSSDPGEQGAKLTLWGSGDDQAMLKEMAAAFEKLHADKNYKVTVNVQDEDKAQAAILKDIDAAADVFDVPHDQLGALVEANACYPNTVYADEVKANDDAGAVQASTYKGTLYGYPRSVQSIFLYYNKSVLSKDDVKTMEGMLKKAKAAGKEVGWDMGNNYDTAPFYFANGVKLFGDDGTDPNGSTFNSPEALAVAKYISTLKAQGLKNINDGDVVSLLKNGSVVAHATGSWKSQEFMKALGDNYAVAKLPTININGEDKQIVSFAGYTLYLVNSHTKYPQAAMQLAAFLTNEENQIKAFKDRKVVPANKKAQSDPSVTSDETVAAQLDQARFSIPMPSVPQMSNFWSDTSMAYTKDLFEGKIKEADMQAKLDAWNDLLKSSIKS